MFKLVCAFLLMSVVCALAIPSQFSERAVQDMPAGERDSRYLGFGGRGYGYGYTGLGFPSYGGLGFGGGLYGYGGISGGLYGYGGIGGGRLGYGFGY